MVPYQTQGSIKRTTYITNSDSSTSTAYFDNSYHEGDELWFTFTAIKEMEEIPILFKEKPHFDRIMKMRNTDGRPIKYSTWKPIRTCCGRDNIGTRNFKKMEGR